MSKRDMQPGRGYSEAQQEPRRPSILRPAQVHDHRLGGDGEIGSHLYRPTRPYDLSQASPEGLARLYRALLEGFTDEERVRLETMIADNVSRLRGDGNKGA